MKYALTTVLGTSNPYLTRGPIYWRWESVYADVYGGVERNHCCGGMGSEKLCTCIMLLSTFLFRHCTNRR